MCSRWIVQPNVVNYVLDVGRRVWRLAGTDFLVSKKLAAV